MGKDKGEGGKRTRKLKDTNAPRKAVSAFMLWSQTERTNVKNANPDMDFGNIGRKMGELWRELPAEEKAVRGPTPAQTHAPTNKKHPSKHRSHPSASSSLP